MCLLCFRHCASIGDIRVSKAQSLPEGALGHMGDDRQKKHIENNYKLLEQMSEFGKVAGYKSNT